METIIIGIAGGSASGKSSIAKELYEIFNEDMKKVAIIRQDDYYKDQSHMSMEERIKTNYDHPFAFDNDLLVDHLDALIRYESINKPTYDFVNHTRSDKTENIDPLDVIILEGLFVLEIKLFVDTDADIRFIRRLTRDVNERGRTLENVISQYVNTVRKMHNQFLEPSKRYADVIIPEGKENVVAIDLVATKIASILNSK